MVQIIATSDLHGELPPIPECDLLLICGDICPDGSPTFQAKWLDSYYREWLKSVPAKQIVGIAGNHDIIFEQAPSLVPDGLNWHYLQDDALELWGLKIYGTPWQLPFWGAFNLDDKALAQKYAALPRDIDIFISHAPPYGILDTIPQATSAELENGASALVLHTGSLSLRNKIFEVKPRLFVCGHIHCAYGVCKVGDTIFGNVCLLNDQMQIANPPVSFNLSPQEKPAKT